jgi:hypothetical protein
VPGPFPGADSDARKGAAAVSHRCALSVSMRCICARRWMASARASARIAPRTVRMWFRCSECDNRLAKRFGEHFVTVPRRRPCCAILRCPSFVRMPAAGQPATQRPNPGGGGGSTAHGPPPAEGRLLVFAQAWPTQAGLDLLQPHQLPVRQFVAAAGAAFFQPGGPRCGGVGCCTVRSGRIAWPATRSPRHGPGRSSPTLKTGARPCARPQG